MSNAEHDQAIDAAMRLIEAGRVADARAALRSIADRHPGSAEPWRLLGVLALQRGYVAEAQAALDHAQRAAPTSPEVLCNLGALARATGRDEEAEGHYRAAIAHDPACVPALNNLGGLLFEQGRLGEADAAYRSALAVSPSYAPARGNLAVCLLGLSRADEALREAQQATRDAPGYAPAWFALGTVQLALGQHAPARHSLEVALSRGMRTPDVLYGLAQALDELHEWPRTLAACEAALSLDAGHAAAASLAQYTRRRLCLHDGLAAGHGALVELVERDAEGVAPFAFLSEEATPAAQRRVATRAAEAVRQRLRLQAQAAGSRSRSPVETAPAHAASHGSGSIAGRTAGAPAAGSIRVGFVSSGFGQHPTALLIAELIERLRGSAVETIGYATTPDDGGPLRRRLEHAFARFADLSSLGFAAMADRIREDAPEILIDLRGWGGGSAAELFALRPAPVQVNWLAYPGTSGAPWIDYLLADQFVVPDAERRHYSEALVRLPHCFQPSDTTREVPEPPSRTALGLPDAAVVFACFNNSYKYSPESLRRFWRILAAVPDSVLWLLTGHCAEFVQTNLRRSAAAAGLDPTRLVFLPKQSHEAYLACYRHADLFLDTTPYNAHTTASDALWAGCPVLTRPGRTFASRVAGSLNHTLGLDALNADDDDGFIATAVRLGADRGALADVRRYLEQARRSTPLFDMAGFAGGFERAMSAIAVRHRDGLAPADLDL